jgi:glycerol kinase
MALDQGTTSSRAIIFDRDGALRATAQREFAQIFPRPGWVEHDPLEIWATQIQVAEEALQRAGLEGKDLAAIGITNQRETTIMWDRRSGEPVHNAIVWQDRRTAPLCERLKSEGYETEIRERTGLVADAYFSGSKIAWLLEHLPGVRAAAEQGRLAFGTVDSWLLWKLTGGDLHVTDPSNASRTMLYNIHHNDWDDELLTRLDVPRALLPDVRQSSEPYCEARQAPLHGVPVAGIAGDQQAALFGQGCFEPGTAKSTYGTGCFVLMNAGSSVPRSTKRLITTVGWGLDGRTTYALEGSVFIGGAVVQWLRDGLGLIRSAAEVERLASSVEDNGGVYLVPAFAGLGAPHWDPHARGLIAGLTRGATAGHLARAALEGIAYQVADVLEAMRAEAATDLPELRVDGGACSNDLLMQFQADILRVPIVRPRETESTARGAAWLAGLAVGLWSGFDELRAQTRVERRFEPTMARERADALRGDWQAALDRSRAWARERSTG